MKKTTMIKKKISDAIASFFPEKWKQFSELYYWKKQKSSEGKLKNDHYKYFYTEHFGLTDSFYAGKRVLDIGCGPRGSLEWADMTKQRIGLDPLADDYLKLGADKHDMQYVCSASENMPFENDSFDIVCSFNSLDHVSGLQESINEIKRVTAAGGICLLLVEINHEPTACEPHKLTPNIVTDFEPEFKCVRFEVYKPSLNGAYDSIKNGDTFPDPQNCKDAGWLSAKFIKV